MNYFNEPDATNLENIRDKVREKKILTYDCFEAQYPASGTRVKCAKGHPLSPSGDKCLDIITILTGRRGAYCQSCPDFNTEEGEI